MTAPPIIVALVERFSHHQSEYMLPHYNEALLRRDFLDPFFGALGWDMENKRGYAEAYREVIHEESLKIEDSSRSPDYTFRIGVTRKFFVEAKKPSVDIVTAFEPAYQLRRYGWSATLALSVLTTFRDFCVYDCRVPPEEADRPSDHRVLKIHFEEYVDRWEEIYAIFARESILKGAFDKFASSKTPPRGTIPPDARFLEQINGWRKALAKNLAQSNDLSQAHLNYAVGQTIDRIVFLRICEDRGTEKFGTLFEAAQGSGIYAKLIEIFRKADRYYNSGLFYLSKQRGRSGEPDELTPKLNINDYVLRNILKPLYEKNPYEFRFVPIEILGQVYEQFLGCVIQVHDHHADVVEKPEVKKAGGIVYTPSYIVDFIVNRTIAALCKGKTPADVAKLRILDPACGSGTFLIGAYNYLLDWHLEWYVSHEDPKKGHIYETRTGWRLSEAERRRILLTNIYGVDIDAQAVEVTKLSLMLKLLEGASKDALEIQFKETHEPVLPNLDGNIRAGNSLIASDFYKLDGTAGLAIEQRKRINAFDWDREFRETMTNGGFDAVIGNPPYVLLQREFKDPLQYVYFHKHYFAAFKVDLYHLFIEKVVRLTRSGGFASLITPSNYLTNNYLVKLRRYMIQKGKLQNLTVIDGKVFQHRSVDTAIFVARKVEKQPGTLQLVRSRALPGLPQLSTTPLRTSQVLSSPEVLFTGGNRGATSLWRRLDRSCIALGAKAYVNFGKQLRDRTQYPNDVLEVTNLSDVPANYVPCYTGNDVERYSVRWSGLACLNDTTAQRGGCWNPARQDQLNKLLTRQIGFWPEYALDDRGYQCLNTVFMINPKSTDIDMYCLLAALNSKLLRAHWLDKYYDRRRTFPKIKGTYIKKLPIPTSLFDPKEENGALGNDLRQEAHRAIELRERLHNASPSESSFLNRECEVVDRRIDTLVYRLYGLTNDEIAVVNKIADDHSTLEAAFRAASNIIPEAVPPIAAMPSTIEEG